MDRFNEIKKRFRARGKRCGYIGGEYETHHGLVLPCCSSFHRTCTPRAFDELERVIVELCNENEKLKSQVELLKAQKQPTVTNNFVQNNVYVQNNVIGIGSNDILQVVRKCMLEGRSRNDMYAMFKNLIAAAPPSESRNRELSLIHSNNNYDWLDAQIRIHSAFNDALNDSNPADAKDLDAFMQRDYNVIEHECAVQGIEIVEDDTPTDILNSADIKKNVKSIPVISIKLDMYFLIKSISIIFAIALIYYFYTWQL